MVKIILASKSKVRKQILDDNNIFTEVQNSNLDEDIVKESLIKEKASPELISKNLAELKANKVSQKNQGFLVIGADSVIDLDGELISKPINRDQALEILKKLNGKKHNLISSVCISQNGAMIWNYTDKATLTMKQFSLDELKSYLSKITDEALYAYNVYQIEGEGRKLFLNIEGDEDTIMGLPIKKNKTILKQLRMKKYLVIGNPIDHSLSPKLQNWWLKENNIDATYDKIKLEVDEIKNFIQEIKEQKIAGCNVTVPFKKTVIPFLDRLSPEAEQTQSVNTITYDNGDLVGHNTDIAGFDSAIKKLDFSLKGKKVMILGAGGVVPSIIFALQKMNVQEITISNRTKERAENLKVLFNNIKILKWGNLTDFHMVINATSLGLNNEKINLKFSSSGNDRLFYDVIYNPHETQFLKMGKQLGCKIENGKTMFVYQALEAFKLWHSIEPKVNTDTFKLLDND